MANYEDPRWQKLRLEVFQRDEWKCVACGDPTSTLVAHHKRYVGEIWESPAADLQTLCKQCHEDFGKHPKGGVYWENDDGVRVLHVLHCPLCLSAHFKDKGGHFKCCYCGWSTDAWSAVTCHATLHEKVATPILFSQEIQRVYLAGKMADPWRDQLITNGEHGTWSQSRGIHRLAYDNEDQDGAWPVLRGVVNVPACSPIDLCGPYWNASLDPWGGHGHAGLVDRHAPQTHACGTANDWDARFATMARCRRAINRCDLFFAWFSSMDAYGTLVEIGMAVRCKCAIVIAYDTANTNQDLWFAMTVADATVGAASAAEAWSKMWAQYSAERRLSRDAASLLAAFALPQNASLNQETANG